MKCPHGQVQWVQDQEGNWHRSVVYEIHSLPCMSARTRGIGARVYGACKPGRRKAAPASLYTHTMTKTQNAEFKWVRKPVGMA